MFRSGLFNYSSGDSVTCIIKGYIIENAKIHLSHVDVDTTFVKAWICHNNPHCDGSLSPERHGYRYSWVFELYKDGSLSQEVVDLKPSFANIDRKKNVEISSNLDHFLRLNKLDRVLGLLYYKLGIFDEFESYDIGKGDGCILLSNSRKSVEIKLSRFVRQMSNKFDEIISNGKMNITDQFVESIHNKLVSYQKDSQIVSLLSGKDILKGYTSSNYMERGGTIQKSCMVDKFDFLNIYTENPNQVQLAVICIEDKITCRCLIWTATDGKKYSDRIYYQYDWMEPLMLEKVRKLGITPIFEAEDPFVCVQLEKWKFEKYPYADNFYFFDKKNGKLVYVNLDRFSQLRNTNGTFIER